MDDWKGIQELLSPAGGLSSSARHLYLELTMSIVRVLMDYFNFGFPLAAHVHLAANLQTPRLRGW
jgi:hypothetical protein